MFFNRNSAARLQDRENGVRYEKAARGLEADIEWHPTGFNINNQQYDLIELNVFSTLHIPPN
ncbi:hypothetical protein, partial [Klebsiella pneumoniae]|uniref:hypothetical protein n=1 Tax=Klebsiella pneumoniae TaxID=573 RepID=UPI001C6FBFB1